MIALKFNPDILSEYGLIGNYFILFIYFIYSILFFLIIVSKFDFRCARFVCRVSNLIIL